MTEPSLMDRPETTVAPAPDGAEGLWSDAWREIRRRPLFWIGSVIIVVLLVMALLPSLFTSVDPRAADLAFSGQAPSAAAPFGYDLQGRDVYSRAIHGAAPTLLVGFLATLGSVLFGSLMGLIAGYASGWFDAVISRIAEIFAALPFVLGGIVLITAFIKPGQVVPEAQLLTLVVLTIVLLTWPLSMRIMRAAAITARQQDYVRAARALGASPGRIMFRHMLPNCLAPVLVFATIQFGVNVSAEATLSFLGIGLRDPVVSWGVMIAESQDRIAQIPHAILFPAAFLVVTVLAFVMLGDALRDALDPRGR